MNQDYDWMISKQATERFIRHTRTQRTKLIDFFNQLAQGVHMEPEDAFTDSEGTEFLLSTMDSMVVTYRIDHPVKMVYIIALE